jgi:hypothetical protein
VKFDRAGATLEIAFERELDDQAELGRRSFLRRRELRVPVARSVLRIHNVLEWSIDDREHAGTQVLDKVWYEPERELVTVESDVAMTVTARVSQLRVVVEDTEERVGTRSY